MGRVDERRGPLFELLLEARGGGHDGVDLGGSMCAEARDSLLEALVCEACRGWARFHSVLEGRAAVTCKHIKFMNRTHMTTDNVSKKRGAGARSSTVS